jgi:hypothetical protein
MAQTLARHIVETGRIRIGHRTAIKSGKNAGKPTPETLKHFRLTSNSREALVLAQSRYGGHVQEWTVRPEWKGAVSAPEDRWELYTESDTLDILIRPDALMDTKFERWMGRVCVLRCDGHYIVKDGHGKLTGLACICPSDVDERRVLAKEKDPQTREPRACEEMSRIVVLLEGLPLGQWRLNTQGFYAPAETRGLQDYLEACQVQSSIVPARMRLEHRTDTKMRRDRIETLHYACVVIEPRHAIEELMLAGHRHSLLLPPGIEAEGKTLLQHIEDISPTQDVFDLVAQIESVVLRTTGSLDQWYSWAVTTFQKARGDWDRDDYARLLQAMRVAASRQRDPAATQALPPEGPQPTVEVMSEGVAQNGPGVTVTGEIVSPQDKTPPPPDLSGPDLFAEEEGEAREKGE